MSAILLHSCTSSKIIRSDTDPSLVRNIDYLYPYSIIYEALDEKTSIHRENASKLSDSLIFLTMTQNADSFKLANFFPVHDSVTIKRYHKELEEIANYVITYNNIMLVEYPKTIDSLFSSRGNRFCMAVFSTGYFISNDKYKPMVIDNLLLAGISGGHIIKHAFKNRSLLMIIIFDTVNKKIAFCRYNDEMLYPLKKTLVKNHFKKILRGYLLPANNLSTANKKPVR